MKIPSVVVIAVLAVTGCEMDQGTMRTGPGGDVASTGRPIYYGDPDTNPAHAAVVALTNSNRSYFCSGTLIAPNVVLTAAHCLEGMTVRYVMFGNSNDSSGDYRTATEQLAHPDYNGDTPDDIGLVRLQSTPSNVTPIPALPASLALTSTDNGKTTVDFSGFGLTETGSDGDKLHVTGTVGLVCPGPSSCSYSGNEVVARAFGYAQSNGGPCSGDSGGPAFVVRNGTEYVAGVTSYGDQNCTQFGVSTLVSSYGSFIGDFIGTPTEICTNGVDDDDDGQVDCDDADCASAPACQPNICDSAPTISCGQSVSGSTSTGSSAFENYTCPEGDATETGPEVAYKLSVPANAHVTADLTIGSAGAQNLDLDLILVSAAGSTCNPSSCVSIDGEADTTPEQIVFDMPSGGAYLIIETYFDDTHTQTGSYTLTLTCDGLTAENCTNGADDDGDGQVDCADTDCANDPSCQTSHENCTNGVDDDGDGQVDCADTDCANEPSCQTGAEDCTNGVDDDNDGQVDCADPDCANAANCQTGGENCTNGVDDDNDGQVDCADTDCAGTPTCQLPSEICNNGVDDDGDQRIDCADPDCANASNCVTPKDTGDSGGGCGCRTAGGARPSLYALLVLGFLALLPRRRRR